jgi:TolB-like protein
VHVRLSALWVMVFASSLFGRAEAGDVVEPNLAFLPLWSAGVSDDAADRLAEEVHKNIRALPGVVPTTRLDSRSHLKAAQSLGLGCGQSDVECFVKVGALAGVTRVVAGFVRPGEGGVHLELRLVDVAGQAELRRVDKIIRQGKRKKRKDLEEVVTKLLAPSLHVGRLQIEGTPRGARVWVGDLARGTLPLRKPLNVAAGFQKIRVEKDGYAPHQEIVEVPYKETLKIKIRLKRGDEPSVSATDDEAFSGQRFRLLVLDPTVNAGDEVNPRTLGSLIAVELAAIPYFDVMSGADLVALADLSASRQAVGCEDSACLSDLGKAMGANLLVAGDVGKLGAQYLINVGLLDAAKSVSLGRTSVRTHDINTIPSDVAKAIGRLAADFLRSRGIDVVAPEPSPEPAPIPPPPAPDNAKPKGPAPAAVEASPTPDEVVVASPDVAPPTALTDARERPFPVGAMTVSAIGGVLFLAGGGAALTSIYPAAYYNEGLERFAAIQAVGDPRGELPALHGALSDAQSAYYGLLLGGVALAGVGLTVAATGALIASLPTE